MESVADVSTSDGATDIELERPDEAAAITNCDIIMKGGVTSGVVYPSAVVEIAKRFRFKNVGGTSAGAIAAVLTAAAERSRALGSDAGFNGLALVPQELSENDLLYRLFAPNEATTALFKTIVALVGRPRFPPAFASKAASLFSAYPLATAAGTLPGIVSYVCLRHEPARKWFALATTVAGVAISVTIALARDVVTKLPKNFYGLVTGLAKTDPANGLALNVWLESKIEALSGLEAQKYPLTFGMLWNPGAGAVACGIDEPPPTPTRAINLEMISTNVTLGRPYRWPTRTSGLYYRADELSCFFPPHVMEWLEKHPRQPSHENEAQLAKHAKYREDGYLPLPPIGDLPIIVATRMSLAFPVLLSAVPLYSVDFSLKLNKEPEPDASANHEADADAPAMKRTPVIPSLERCWFSDGGLSSNFPVTLFDSPLPRWPTFAINLRPFPPGRTPSENEDDNVYMVRDNKSGRLPEWTRFKGITGFFSALFNAMQNWNDSTQIVLPGYRDRMVTVFLSGDEGGLNLDMPSPLLQRLAKRGAAAGRLITARFASPAANFPASDTPHMDWTNHRWLRYRTTMGALRTYLAAFAEAYAQTRPDPSYQDLILGSAELPVPSYPLPRPALETIKQLSSDLAQSGKVLSRENAIDKHLPSPRPQLGVRATLDA